MLSGWLCLRARRTSYSSEPGLGRATSAAEAEGGGSGAKTSGTRTVCRAARSRLAVRRLPDHAENHIAAWYLQQFSPRCKADQRRSPGLAALEKFARPTLRRALG